MPRENQVKINIVVALALSAGTGLCAFYPAFWPAVGNAARGESQSAAENAGKDLSNLPVKEVTIFKDGHALVLRSGNVTVDEAGEAHLEDLPRPLLGTFFPFGESETLQSVKVGQVKKQYRQTALSYEELLRANPGAEVTIGRQTDGGKATALHQGTLAKTPLPVRNMDELKRLKKLSTAGDTAYDLKQPQVSPLVEIEEAGGGATFVPISEINRLSFKSAHKAQVENETMVDALTLRFEKQKTRQVKAGVMYVQAGMRWLPSYKVTLAGNGKAHLKMEATIVNDLIDLDDSNVQLVVGVPSFATRGELDPIALSRTLSEVAAHSERDSYLSNNRRNAIQITSQQMGSMADDESTAGNEGSSTVDKDLPGARHEDLFVFSLKHVSLKRGERLVIPVMESTVDYEDLYTLDVPVKPPGEIMAASSSAASKNDGDDLRILHKIRLKNTDARPFTTAPALILDSQNKESGETAVGQSILTYAPKGASSDLTLTEAINVKAVKKENEISREDAAKTWLGSNYAKINLAGTLVVTNYSDKAIKLEIKRNVLGQVDSNSPTGKAEMLNATALTENPGWWYSYNWPAWWAQMNGLGKFTFREEIAAHQKVEAKYKWHYFWR